MWSSFITVLNDIVLYYAQLLRRALAKVAEVP